MLDLSLWTAIGGGAFAISAFLVARTLTNRKPGDRLQPIPASFVAVLVGTFWPPRGWFSNFYSHFIPFDRAGGTCVPLYEPIYGKRYLEVADAGAAKSILNDRKTYMKDVEMYRHVMFLGKNIIGIEGDDWVRHRSIARKSFGDRNNALLWKVTTSILSGSFAKWDAAIAASPSSTATVNITTELRTMMLFVIASAGFDLQFNSSASSLGSDSPQPGYTMSFSNALVTSLENVFVRVIAPKWAYKVFWFSHTLQEVDTAFNDLRRYIGDIIDKARAKRLDGNVDGGDEEDSEEAADLFRRLIDSNDEADANSGLSNDELASNVFAFFLAGHETSAHSLTFAFALLAIHPEIQEKVYQESKGLWPSMESDSWTASPMSDFNKLDYTLATFRETLRLFPAVSRLMRTVMADSVLPCHNRNPMTGAWEPGTVEVERGMEVTLSIAGIHKNPMYWGADAHKFRPERFIDDPATGYEWPRDAWIPFIAGPRVCIGQRFALIESTCVLARILRRYRIAPTPAIAKLPQDEQWKVLTKWTLGMTSNPGQVELVFERRAD